MGNCGGGGESGGAKYAKASGTSSPYLQSSDKLKGIVQGRKWNIEDFDIHETIGVGAYGRVRLVKVKGSTDQTPLALKILKKSECMKLKQAEHVVAERKIHRNLSHPFIVNMLTTFQDEKRLFMLLEFVNGGELAQRIYKTVKLPEDDSRFYAAEVCLALSYLGSQNVAYRDLKPDNVLIDADGHARLCDFGFAKVIKSKETTNSLCGTPEYMAPEIIRMKGHDKAVDWWALGVLVFEMVNGTPPFAAETPQGTYELVLKCNLEFPGSFSIGAKECVKKLLVDRTKRPAGDSVKRFSWFKGLDWNALGKRGFAPPYVPTLNSGTDTWNFERYPESTCESGEALDADDEKLFSDF